MVKTLLGDSGTFNIEVSTSVWLRLCDQKSYEIQEPNLGVIELVQYDQLGRRNGWQNVGQKTLVQPTHSAPPGILHWYSYRGRELR